MEHRRAAPLALAAASALVAATCGFCLGVREARGRPPTPTQPVAPAAQRSLFDMAPPSYKEGYYRWMWADATVLWEHELAEADPLHWSDWLSAAGIIADLEAYRTTKHAFRPVELMAGRDSNRLGAYKPQLQDSGQGSPGLQKCQGDCDSDSDCEGALMCFQRDGYAEVPGCAGFGSRNWDYCYEGGGRSSAGHAAPLRFDSIDEAIAYLGEQTTTQTPRVAEPAAQAAAPAPCPDACRPDAGAALGLVALGSALTLAAGALCCCGACAVRGAGLRPSKGRGLRGEGGSSSSSDSESSAGPPRSAGARAQGRGAGRAQELALADGRAPQPYQGVLQDSDLATLLADIEEEEQRLPAGPRSLGPASPTSSGALREEAAREVDRVLGAKGAREIFGNDGPVERRAQYRRLVRLLHPDKKAAEGQRASLALRRVVECYRSLSDVA